MNIVYRLKSQQIQELYGLYQQEWWSKGRSLAETISCVKGSPINIGITDEESVLQAYARVLTDYTFKAFIFDVIVADKCRGKGLGRQLISAIKHHDQLQQVKHFELYCLPGMFDFYKRYGFTTEVGEIKLVRFTKETVIGKPE